MASLYQGKQRELQEARCFQKDGMIGYPRKKIYRTWMIRNLNKINCIEHTGLEICEDTFSLFLCCCCCVTFFNLTRTLKGIRAKARHEHTSFENT
jgi:hypothetical protein